MLIEGTTIFNTHLTKTEWFGDGPAAKDTEKYSIQIKLDKDSANKLSKEGVKIKEYEGEPIRKFTSRYPVSVHLNANEAWTDELPSGSIVRIEYTTKQHHQHGMIPYFKRVLVKEMGEGGDSGDKSFFEDNPPF